MSELTQEQSSPPELEDGVRNPIAELEDEFALKEALRIKLDQFEGPFEVLLYLIRTQEIDIFDIPIVRVTEQYLEFLDLLHEKDLDIAGEFIVMAATLIQIKSKMILPLDLDDEEEEVEEEDPRLELVEKLLEYRKYRELCDHLGDLYEARQDSFGRRIKPSYEITDDGEDLEVSLYDLIKAIRGVLRFITELPIHQVEMESSSVDEKIDEIASLLESQESITWTELFKRSKSKTELVCSLLAILELCRMNRIRAHQHGSYGEIRIFARDPEEEATLAVVLEPVE